MKRMITAIIVLMAIGCSPIYYTDPPSSPGIGIGMSSPGIGMGSVGFPAIMAFPSQNIAFINGYPKTWGKRRRVIRNDTQFYMAIRMNGVQVQFRDSTTALPHLPPGTEASFAIAEFGEINFEAKGYLPPDFAKPVVKCEKKKNFSPIVNYHWQGRWRIIEYNCSQI